MSFVLDSSMALTWCLPGQANPLSMATLKKAQQGGAVVPVIWHIEVANILGLKLRSGFLSQSDLRAAVSLLNLIDIRTDDASRRPDIGSLLSLTSRIQLTAYDAMYLDLALGSGLSLATFDKAMLEAARQHGVPVVSF